MGTSVRRTRLRSGSGGMGIGFGFGGSVVSSASAAASRSSIVLTNGGSSFSSSSLFARHFASSTLKSSYSSWPTASMSNLGFSADAVSPRNFSRSASRMSRALRTESGVMGAWSSTL